MKAGIVSITAITLLPIAGFAQESRSVLDEIVVTAQKREQNLQDVGIAVTAFSSNQVEALGFTNSTDVVAMTPGLNYTIPQGESSNINLFLRGVGLNDFSDNNENPVAIYVDEVYHPATGGLSFQLFDMERIEVLRGPQGSLFGRNTTGGLVHYVSRRPADEVDGYFNLTGGSNSQIKLEAAIGGPLGDSVAGRLSVATNQYDGYTDNRAGPDYNEGDSRAVRGQLAFSPSDSLDVLLSVLYSDSDAAVGAWQHQATTLDANGDSVALGANEQRGIYAVLNPAPCVALRAG